MKLPSRYHGLFAVLAASLLIYPGFLLGQFMANAISELPQAFQDHPVRLAIGIVVNLLILGAVHRVLLCKPHQP